MDYPIEQPDRYEERTGDFGPYMQLTHDGRFVRYLAYQAVKGDRDRLADQVALLRYPYCLSCPWCGLPMLEMEPRLQIPHLIVCGDRRYENIVAERNRLRQDLKEE